MISVLDYGAGNLRSVANTLDAIGAPYELVRDAASLARATKIVLPGVGHFGQMMRALDQMDVRQALLDRIEAGVPFFGICLGMQALFTASDEAPEERGLGIFEGRVQRFVGDVRIPHMGWNSLELRSSSLLLAGAGTSPFVYFAHSYYAPVVAATAATCDYTLPYTAILEHKNIFGVQFHPEKSAAVGQSIVRNFVEM
ncbi:MAG TPA: imidazole glycerol phosphate synthase subunit HisH [Bryobacteraceae bacterium]|nr:imidazole glycerol phosphate synthase subunit HisH [Bryobacteraceae bacterium]